MKSHQTNNRNNLSKREEREERESGPLDKMRDLFLPTNITILLTFLLLIIYLYFIFVLPLLREGKNGGGEGGAIKVKNSSSFFISG